MTAIDIVGNELGLSNPQRASKEVTLEGCLTRGQSMVTQSCAFRRCVIDRFGPFMPELTHEGIPLAFRCVALGRIGFLPTPLTKYRVGSGVSTYSGSDIRKLKTDEPSKFSKWYLTGFAQISRDIQRVKLKQDDASRLVGNNIEIYKSIHSINISNTFIEAMIIFYRSRMWNAAMLRALLRRSCPHWLYAAVIRTRSAVVLPKWRVRGRVD